MGRRRLALAGALLAAIVVVTGVLVGGDDGDRGDDPRPPATSTTTAATATSAPSTTTTTAPADEIAVVWPARNGSTTFDEPDEAARSFVVDFLRFRGPVLAPPRVDAGEAEVDVRPREGGPVTTVTLVELGSGWWVTGTRTPNIEVSRPSSGDTVGSPVEVAGRAHAFEGTVLVEAREAGSSNVLGAGFVTGGGDELRPFSGSITFGPPSRTGLVLVFFTESAEDGEVWEAAVVPVTFARN